MTKPTDACEEFTPDAQRVSGVHTDISAVQGISEIFRVLGDQTRTQIVWALANQELCVCDIAQLLGVSSSLVSHHLRLLRHLRLVKFRKEGKQAFYTLDDDHVVQLIHAAIDHYHEQAASKT
ncbi:MAG TPA: helix-turn-helix transcriptional regulator [Firmicutes bacterium]|jgi:DNA-binding transcriptional ArsR family regulator|nr:helix-turn-helix transcriptional regulator [Bacillota bacterium]